MKAGINCYGEELGHRGLRKSCFEVWLENCKNSSQEHRVLAVRLYIARWSFEIENVPNTLPLTEEAGGWCRWRCRSGNLATSPAHLVRRSVYACALSSFSYNARWFAAVIYTNLEESV